MSQVQHISDDSVTISTMLLSPIFHYLFFISLVQCFKCGYARCLVGYILATTS